MSILYIIYVFINKKYYLRKKLLNQSFFSGYKMDLKLLLFLLLFFEIKTEDSFKQFWTKIFETIFPNPTCLYFISDNTAISHYVEQFIMELAVPMVILPYNNLKNHYKIIYCDGSIIAWKNLTSLERLFQIPNEFKAHSRILVLLEVIGNFDTYIFKHAVHLKALDILIMEGFVFNNNKWFGSFTLEHVSIKSIKENKTLLTRHSNNFGVLKKRDFVPTFEINGKVHMIRASVFNCTPFVYYDEIKGVYDGWEYRIFEDLVQNWPRRYITHNKKEGEGFVAISEDVEAARSDIAFCSLWMTQVSRRNADMTIPILQTYSSFLVPKPRLLPGITYNYQPLNLKVWISYFLLIHIISYLLHLAANSYKRRSCKTIFTSYSVCYLYALRYFTLGSFSQFPPQSQAILRYCITTWALAAVILASAYSAGFSSLQIYPRFTKPIKTVEDMLEQNIYWGTPNNDTFLFEGTTNPQRLALLQRYKTEHTVQDRLDRIRNDDYAFTVINVEQYITFTDSLDDYGKKYLMVLSEKLGVYGVVFAVKKNSAFTKIFNDRLYRLQESGLVDYWYTVVKEKYRLPYMENFFSVYSNVLRKYSPLSLEKMYGSFFIILLGYFVSIVIFVSEIIMYYLDTCN